MVFVAAVCLYESAITSLCLFGIDFLVMFAGAIVISTGLCDKSQKKRGSELAHASSCPVSVFASMRTKDRSGHVILLKYKN